MSGFDDRKKAFENKFKHDEELRFKAEARRNKLLGLWAAGELGIDDAEAYARDVIASDFDRPGDEDVLEKVLKDFEDKGVEMSQHRLRKRMDDLMDEAKKQIASE